MQGLAGGSWPTMDPVLYRAEVRVSGTLRVLMSY